MSSPNVLAAVKAQKLKKRKAKTLAEEAELELANKTKCIEFEHQHRFLEATMEMTTDVKMPRHKWANGGGLFLLAGDYVHVESDLSPGKYIIPCLLHSTGPALHQPHPVSPVECKPASANLFLSLCHTV